MNTDLAVGLSRAHGFLPDALEANRAGLLTPDQARGLRRKGTVAVVIAIALGLFLLASGGLALVAAQVFAEEVPAGDVQLAAYLSLAGGIFFLVLVYRFLRALPADLAAGLVAGDEGFIRKYTTQSSSDEGDTTYTYHYRFKGRRFDVARAGYEAPDTQLRYRVYDDRSSGPLSILDDPHVSLPPFRFWLAVLG